MIKKDHLFTDLKRPLKRRLFFQLTRIFLGKISPQTILEQHISTKIDKGYRLM
jgi:hypothetical protein